MIIFYYNSHWYNFLFYILWLQSITDIQSSFNQIINKTELYTTLFIAGMTYYIFNELQNIVLSSLGPVSTAVGKGKCFYWCLLDFIWYISAFYF